MKTAEEFFDKLPKTYDELVQYFRDEGVTGTFNSCPLVVLGQPWMDDGLVIFVGSTHTYVYKDGQGFVNAPEVESPEHVAAFVRAVDTGQLPDIAGEWPIERPFQRPIQESV